MVNIENTRNKKTRLLSGFFADMLHNFYSGEIASTGQTSAQAPQSVHASGSIE
jgi:hypothetical protein